MSTPEKTTIEQLRENVRKAEEELRVAEEEEAAEEEKEANFAIDSDFLPLPWEVKTAPGGHQIVTDADGETVFEYFSSGAEEHDPWLGLECMISRINEGLRCKRTLEK